MSYAGCPGPSPAILAQFTSKYVSQPEIAKITKNLYFVGSSSFKVIHVDNNKKLVTIACCNKQHVCAYL